MVNFWHRSLYCKAKLHTLKPVSSIYYLVMLIFQGMVSLFLTGTFTCPAFQPGRFLCTVYWVGEDIGCLRYLKEQWRLHHRETNVGRKVGEGCWGRPLWNYSNCLYQLFHCQWEYQRPFWHAALIPIVKTLTPLGAVEPPWHTFYIKLTGTSPSITISK